MLETTNILLLKVLVHLIQMNRQKALLITSILVVVGIASLFLGVMTYQNQSGWISVRENISIRNQAYIEIAIGFVFIGIGIATFLVYGRTHT